MLNLHGCRGVAGHSESSSGGKRGEQMREAFSLDSKRLALDGRFFLAPLEIVCLPKKKVIF